MTGLILFETTPLDSRATSFNGYQGNQIGTNQCTTCEGAARPSEATWYSNSVALTTRTTTQEVRGMTEPVFPKVWDDMDDVDFGRVFWEMSFTLITVSMLGAIITGA